MSGYQAFLYRMASGIPGASSRNSAFTIEPGIISSVTPPTEYGIPLALDADLNMRPIQGGDTAGSVQGFLARAFPTNSGTDGIATATPPTSGACDVLKMGYMNVAVNRGTAAKGGKVYIRTIANASYPTTSVGDVEAEGDTPAPVATAKAGNTGNGTVGTLSGTSSTPVGNFTVVFTAATVFRVYDPSGVERMDGATGTQYTTDDGLSFLITAGGTAFAAGDSFTIAVTQNCFVLPNAFFTGPADSNGNSEIAYNIG